MGKNEQKMRDAGKNQPLYKGILGNAGSCPCGEAASACPSLRAESPGQPCRCLLLVKTLFFFSSGSCSRVRRMHSLGGLASLLEGAAASD